MAGYLAGQLVNAWVLVKLRDRARQAKGPASSLWFRLIGSTAVGQLVDTTVFCIIAFYGVIVGWQFLGYTVLGYVIKVGAEVVLFAYHDPVIAWVRRREGVTAEL